MPGSLAKHTCAEQLGISVGSESNAEGHLELWLSFRAEIGVASSSPSLYSSAATTANAQTCTQLRRHVIGSSPSFKQATV